MEIIRQVLKSRGSDKFYVTGNKVSADGVSLTYKGLSTNCITFPCHDKIGLADLYHSGQRAMFGIGDKDVMDVTYRSAKKLDPSSFTLDFCPCKSEITSHISSNLFNVPTGVRAELYKVNVYGPGDFFKEHVDTPRSTDMFGTLLVCLPTDHKGGDLRLTGNVTTVHDYELSDRGSMCSFDDDDEEKPCVVEQERETYNFKSSKDNITWVAFFSDVTHEVLPVTEGYRVTVSYNLYYSDVGNAESVPNFFKDTFVKHEHKLAVPGMVYGYCLENRYPVKFDEKAESVVPFLRGRDLLFYKACTELGWEVYPVVVHELLKSNKHDLKDVRAHFCNLDEFLKCPEMECFTPTFPKDRLKKYRKSKKISVACALVTTHFKRAGHNNGADYEDCRDCSTWSIAVEDCEAHGLLDVKWLNTTFTSQIGNRYSIYYGNESGNGHYYSSAALIVRVPLSG